ncbi:hypothetical protein BDA96_02G082300 [Sorghum bicolor]|uniref:Uncharacterized protein n=1 Tax=Sorghum bicolor TaxID=4558 RepID=A0A921RM10_SORBI|nr:hypothetical protein BDA96_02G082300 [Sorghum bicolor]
MIMKHKRRACHIWFNCRCPLWVVHTRTRSHMDDSCRRRAARLASAVRGRDQHHVEFSFT